jgi:hypothetical protein
VIVPGAAGVTDAEPLTGSGPDQSLWLGLAEAVHDVTFLLDQESVTDCPSVTMLEDAEIDTVGGALLAPPPHPLRNHRMQAMSKTDVGFLITDLMSFILAVSLTRSLRKSGSTHTPTGYRKDLGHIF